MIEKNDLGIISQLRQNCRTPLEHISEKLNIPLPNIQDRINFLEKDIIRKHTSLLNFSNLGYKVQIKILMNIKMTDFIESYLSNNQNVNSLYLLSGRYNVLAECIFKDTESMENFIDHLDVMGIQDREVFHIAEEIRKERFQPTNLSPS